MLERLKGDQHKLRTQIPAGIKGSLDRGRERNRHFAAKRSEAWEFWRGNPFTYLSDKGKLQSMFAGPVGVKGPGKASWRSRLSRNVFRSRIEMEVSIATQRTPSYQVVPSGSDSKKISSARVAQKVAYYGYDKWDFAGVRQGVCRHAFIGDEGFAWPIWDDQVGPFVDDGEEGTVGVGEVKVMVFGANQVSWESGLKFEDSPWHAVEYACGTEKVTERPDYLGGKLTPDAATDDMSFSLDRADKGNLVRVTEYLERPSSKFPKGRWLMIANSRVVAGKEIVEDDVAYRPYPCQEYGYEGIALHYVTQYPDDDSDRGQGMGRDLVDPARTIVDCVNRLIEWKNLALNPQSVGHPGAMKGQKRTDEPGKHYEVPNPNEAFKWLDTPQIPRELFEMIDRSEADMDRIAAQTDIAAASSGKEIQLLNSHDLARRDAFFKSLARFDSSLMRHCLVLVQRYYKEERLLQIKGVAGWEPLEDFLGANLMDETDVRVMPDSLVPTTREQVQAKVFAYADRQWISPERAMQALEEGTAEGLIRDLENDAGRVNRIIQKIRQGPEALFALPVLKGPDMEPAIDPDTGMPTVNPSTGEPVLAPRERPGWVPRPFDNTTVHRYYIETFMKSLEFEQLEPAMQAATFEYLTILDAIDAEKAARQQAAQMQMAQERGEANAARPTPDSPAMPDMPSPTPGAVPTQNQPADQQGVPVA